MLTFELLAKRLTRPSIGALEVKLETMTDRQTNRPTDQPIDRLIGNRQTDRPCHREVSLPTTEKQNARLSVGNQSQFFN